MTRREAGLSWLAVAVGSAIPVRVGLVLTARRHKSAEVGNKSTILPFVVVQIGSECQQALELGTDFEDLWRCCKKMQCLLQLSPQRTRTASRRLRFEMPMLANADPNASYTTLYHIISKFRPHRWDTGSRRSCFTTSPDPTRRASTTSQPPTRSRTVEFPLTGNATEEANSVARGAVSRSDRPVEYEYSPRVRNASQSSSKLRRRGGGWAELQHSRARIHRQTYYAVVSVTFIPCENKQTRVYQSSHNPKWR